MKTKHSPGPFSRGGSAFDVNNVFDANGVAIADASDRSSGANEGQRKANARLFAAAPDLLAALIKARTHISDQDDDKDDQMVAFIDELGAAVSKATGNE